MVPAPGRLTAQGRARGRSEWVVPGLVVCLLVGLIVWMFLAYQVLMTGGDTFTSLRASCAQAATGHPDALYRITEPVTISRSYLPPRAVCVWSGGTTALIIRVTALSWVGPSLVLIGVVGLLAVNLLRRTAGRRRSRTR